MTGLPEIDKKEAGEDNFRFYKVLEEAYVLRKKKYAAYGGTYKDFGSLGLVIKVNDKVGRLKQLMKHPMLRKEHQYETMRDSAIDLLNYAAMLVMVLDEEEKQ